MRLHGIVEATLMSWNPHTKRMRRARFCSYAGVTPSESTRRSDIQLHLQSMGASYRPLPRRIESTSQRYPQVEALEFTSGSVWVEPKFARIRPISIVRTRFVRDGLAVLGNCVAERSRGALLPRGRGPLVTTEIFLLDASDFPCDRFELCRGRRIRQAS